MLARSLVFVLFLLAPLRASEPLPRFTEEREAAALHFVNKHCPELSPVLDELKKGNRVAYELQVRETFQVTEFLADLQDDTKRYELELKMWKAENKALLLVAKLAAPKDDDRKPLEEQLRTLAKELVELEIQSLEHQATVLERELSQTRDEITKSRDSFERTVKDRFESLVEKARRKKDSTTGK
jgi:TolA-binding protein